MKLTRGRVRVILALLAALSAVFIWRRTRKRKEQIELFYEDGSMVSVDPGSPQGSRIVPIAVEAVRAARGTPA